MLSTYIPLDYLTIPLLFVVCLLVYVFPPQNSKNNKMLQRVCSSHNHFLIIRHLTTPFPRFSLTFHLASSSIYNTHLHETLDKRNCFIYPTNWNLVTEDQAWQTSGSSKIVKELEHRWLTKWRVVGRSGALGKLTQQSHVRFKFWVIKLPHQ